MVRCFSIVLSFHCQRTTSITHPIHHLASYRHRHYHQQRPVPASHHSMQNRPCPLQSPSKARKPAKKTAVPIPESQTPIPKSSAIAQTLIHVVNTRSPASILLRCSPQNTRTRRFVHAGGETPLTPTPSGSPARAQRCPQPLAPASILG